MRPLACGAAVISMTVVFSSGCGTIINGTTQSLAVSSDPSGATLSLDDGTTYTTPASINLKRDRDHTIKVSKAGYETETLVVSRSMSWWFAGNLLFGGIPGFVIDAISGGMWRFEDETLGVTLRPAGRTHLITVEEFGEFAAHQD
jgi:hypothetical protein